MYYRKERKRLKYTKFYMFDKFYFFNLKKNLLKKLVSILVSQNVNIPQYLQEREVYAFSIAVCISLKRDYIVGVSKKFVCEYVTI